jgi:proteasome lid subunit RPN8/RPN11
VTVIQVSIDSLALRAIEDELRYSAAELRDGCETGGWLWAAQGAAWWRTEGLLIEAASGPGRKARRAPGALTFDTDDLFEFDRVMGAERLEVAGAWHCHPGGDDAPSETDDERVRALLSFRRRVGLSHSACPRDHPHAHGWRLAVQPLGHVSDAGFAPRDPRRPRASCRARRHEGGELISGFETLPQVLGVLVGLEREVPKNDQHAAQINASRELFEAERDRMLKEGRERIRARAPRAPGCRWAQSGAMQ